MNDRTTLTEAIVLEAAAIWQERLGLGHWRVEHTFLNTNHPDDDEERTPAECKPQWNRLCADIEWYLPAIAVYDDEYLCRLALHEMTHVLLSAEQANLKPSDTDRMELTTTMVERVLWEAWAGR